MTRGIAMKKRISLTLALSLLIAPAMAGESHEIRQRLPVTGNPKNRKRTEKQVKSQ